MFQPMLMEYFTYEELKDIKKQVIAQHCSQQQWDCAAEVLKGFSLWSQAEELQKAFKYADHEKTDYGECVCSQTIKAGRYFPPGSSSFTFFRPDLTCLHQTLNTALS